MFADNGYRLMEFVNRFKNALFLILVLLTQAIALAVQVRSPLDPAEPDGPSVRLVRLWATAAGTPALLPLKSVSPIPTSDCDVWVA